MCSIFVVFLSSLSLINLGFYQNPKQRRVCLSFLLDNKKSLFECFYVFTLLLLSVLARLLHFARRERNYYVFALLWNDDDGDGDDDDEFVVVVVVFPRGSIVENDANEFPPPL